MNCTQCGTPLNDAAKFCPSCGAMQNVSAESSTANSGTYAGGTANSYTYAGSTANTAANRDDYTGDPQSGAYVYGSSYNEENYDISQNLSALPDIFIDPDEKLLAKLGNGFLVNLMFGRVKKCHALLSDKRVYLKGAMYTLGKGITKTVEERTLDLKDMTGTGFIYSRLSILSLIISILEFIGSFGCFLLADLANGEFIMPGIVLMLISILTLTINFIKSRKIWFFIDYAGGRIRINARLLGLGSVRDFHKQLRRAKDALVRKE